MNKDMISKLSTKTIFVGLNDEQIKEVMAAAKKVKKKAGEIVVRENEQGSSLYVILEGAVEIRHYAQGEDRFVTSLSASPALSKQYEGDFFGEMSMLDIEPRSATVTAIEDCKFLVLTHETLVTLFAEDASIHIILLTNIARILSHRLRAGMEKAREQMD